MSDIPVPLDVVQGAHLTLTATVTGGAALWPAGHNVIGQVRASSGGPLMLDLTPDLTGEITGDDFIVTLTLSGSDTRKITRNGSYDVFVTDTSGEGIVALRVLHGPVKVEQAITKVEPAP